MRYLSTYFYQDTVDLGASYGNITLPLKDRNEIYWKTVFTLFSSSVPFCSNRIRLVLFTNVKNFPFRDKIEALGVLIFDDLQLTHRNDGSWATVKFFFDVLFYIDAKDFFQQNDSFIMLDTDVVCLNDVGSIFESIENSNKPIVYVLGEKNYENPFHGSSLEKLRMIAGELDEHAKPIVDLIGGEFFCFKKNHLINELNDFNKLLCLDASKLLRTEEEILTVKNSIFNYESLNFHIYRVWTTLRLVDIPKNWRKYTFIHLPSEKETGLLLLFNKFSNVGKSTLTKEFVSREIINCLQLDSLFKIYLRIIRHKLYRFFSWSHKVFLKVKT